MVYVYKNNFGFFMEKGPLFIEKPLLRLFKMNNKKCHYIFGQNYGFEKMGKNSYNLGQ
jgi:hypothetical protein